MNAYLVGADRLGNIPETLSGYGVRILDHVSGRDASHQRKSSLPRRAELLILFTDFLGHNVMRNYRDAAREAGVPVIACRRSCACLKEAMGQCLGNSPCANCPTRSTPLPASPDTPMDTTKPTQTKEAAHAAAPTPPSYTSTQLLMGGREAVIVHAGREYRLRVTASGKLILTA